MELFTKQPNEESLEPTDDDVASAAYRELVRANRERGSKAASKAARKAMDDFLRSGLDYFCEVASDFVKELEGTKDNGDSADQSDGGSDPAGW